MIEITQLKEFINNLKDGLNTIIGDDGLRISGGQRQRIAIARALYFSPELLIMDEATSALDVDIENKIIEILRNLKGKITLIFISHKASNLEIYEDKFEVLDNKIKKYEKNIYVGSGFIDSQLLWIIPLIHGYCKKNIQTIIFESKLSKKVLDNLHVKNTK